jgi:predicted acetyltransferase
VSGGELDVRELVTATDDAYRDLWRFLAEIDLAVSVHAWPRPVDEHLSLHLVDGRALRWRERNDQLWLNVLDVRAVLEARTYATDGTLVLDVDGARWRLDGGPDGATCAATAEAADLVLPVASLGAAYLGGTPWRALASAGRVTEERAGALDRAAAMFSTPRAPFLTTHF